MTADRNAWFARVIAAVAAFDVLAMTQVPWGISAPRPLAAGDPFVALARMPWALSALSLVAWIGLYLFARAPERARFAAVAVAAGFILEETLARVQSGHEEPFFQPAGAVLGWAGAIILLRAVASTPVSVAEARRAGVAGATAVIGASYFNAAISKLLAEGPAWAWHPTHVRAMTLAHQPLPPNALDDLVVGALARSAALGRAAAVFTLVIELGGLAFALWPRARRVASLAIVAWHLGLLYLTGICFYGGLVLIVVLGDRRLPERIERVFARLRLRERRRATSFALLVTLATLPLVALTRSSQRGMATAIVMLMAFLVVAITFWSRETIDADEAAEPVDWRAGSVVVLALAAVIAGLYLLPITPHDAHH